MPGKIFLSLPWVYVVFESQRIGEGGKASYEKSPVVYSRNPFHMPGSISSDVSESSNH